MAVINTYNIIGQFCQPNEGHVTLTCSGSLNGSRMYDVSDFLGNPTNEEVVAAILVLMRRAKQSVTNAQIKTVLKTTGVNIVVGS